MKKILILCRGNTAENLAVTPAVSVLKKNFPRAHIAVLTNKPRVFQFNPAVKETAGFASFFTLLKQIKEANYDLAVNFTPSFKYNLLLKAAGVKKILAAGKNKQNPAQNNIDILKPLFIFTFPAYPVIYQNKKESGAAAKQLADAGLKTTDFIIAVHPAVTDLFTWPKTNYVALIDKICIAYPQVKILLAPATEREAAFAQDIAWQCAKKPFLLKEPLDQNAFINTFARARAALAAYNMPAQTAAAMGKPLCALCPEAEDIIKPSGERVEILRSVNNNIPLDTVFAVMDKFIAEIMKKNKKVLGGDAAFSFFDK